MIHRRVKRTCVAAAIALGTLFQLPAGCNFGEVTTSVTLSGRELIQGLVRSWVLGPIESAIDEGINRLFDQIENGDA